MDELEVYEIFMKFSWWSSHLMDKISQYKMCQICMKFSWQVQPLNGCFLGTKRAIYVWNSSVQNVPYTYEIQLTGPAIKWMFPWYKTGNIFMKFKPFNVWNSLVQNVPYTYEIQLTGPAIKWMFPWYKTSNIFMKFICLVQP